MEEIEQNIELIRVHHYCEKTNRKVYNNYNKN